MCGPAAPWGGVGGGAGERFAALCGEDAWHAWVAVDKGRNAMVWVGGRAAMAMARVGLGRG